MRAKFFLNRFLLIFIYLFLFGTSYSANDLRPSSEIFNRSVSNEMAPYISVSSRKSAENNMESLTLLAVFTDHYHISENLPPIITIYALDRSRLYIRRKIIDDVVMSPYGKKRWAYSWIIKPDITGSYVVKVYSRDENSNYYRPLEKIINFKETSSTDCQKVSNSPEKFWTVSAPTGIAVDSARGFVYVSASNINKIKKFDLNGVFITQWGKPGKRAGEFSGPFALSMDSEGFIYVTDYNNNRVQKFADETDYNNLSSEGRTDDNPF